MDKVVTRVVKELKAAAEPEYKKAQEWFFKEGIDLYGVRTGATRAIGKRVWKTIDPRTKSHVFELCDQLYAIDKGETVIIANQWAHFVSDQFSKSDLPHFKRWLTRYANNWARVDNLCSEVIGPFLIMYPDMFSKTKSWRSSLNRWVRRAAAVCLIRRLQKGDALKEVFEVADELLMDSDDMVQKGYGWMLKEASNHHPEEVFQFVMKRKDRMPRTSLRYAIEKLPKVKRAQAMKK